MRRRNKLLACATVGLLIAVAAFTPKGAVDDAGHPPPFLQSRSGQWPRLRAEHLKAHPECAVCGRKDGCEVHHVRPFHLHPELELDPTNFITLCGPPWNHHFWFGHLGDWSSYNPDVREDAAAWRGKILARPPPQHVKP